MAATDEFENQLPIQNTGKWIRALDANGSPILIPVEEIAKVVGGLMSSLKLFPFMERSIVSDDMNMAKLAGTYSIGKYAENMPEEDWSMYCVFVHGIYIIQLLYTLNSHHLYIRNSNDRGENWARWVYILTQI